jgi:hypothetical protein
MATETQRAQDTDGAALAQMLKAHRTFLENIYALMRLLETELTKQGWELVKPNGYYCVTTNRIGMGLAEFYWSLDHIGIAFVGKGHATAEKDGTKTLIPEEGLEVLAFQVRWLHKSPEQPVVWRVRLRLRPALESPPPTNWEAYQDDVFRGWQAAKPNGAASEALQFSIPVRKERSSISLDGTYHEIPVAQLLTREDVDTLLIQPALSE